VLTRPAAFWLFAALLGGPAAAGFQDVLETPAQISPISQSAPILAVTRAGDRLVAVGVRGHILLSDDQGANWRQVPVPVSSDLTAAYFATPLDGWAVGHDGVVLHSHDGGDHWDKQLDGRGAAQLMEARYEGELAEEARRMEQDGPDKPFLDVWFADAKTGYVVGAFNLIFKTTNGGASWTPLYERTENPQRLHLYTMRPCGKTLCIAGEGGLMLKSQDGSDTFKAVPFPYKGSLFGLVAGRDAILAYGLRGNLFRSADGGAGWSKVETGERSALVGGSGDGTGAIALAAQAGAVLVSHDDGKSFATLRLKRPMPLSGIAALAGDRLVLAGQAGLITMNAGEAAP